MKTRAVDRIWVDPNKSYRTSDPEPLLRVSLTPLGTRRDLERSGIALKEGITLHVWSDDARADGTQDNLVGDGVVYFDEHWNDWAVAIPPEGFRHESEVGAEEP
ncbi:MAG: hypothetical protein M0Z62_14510 [Actinomycetota bacterium]|nr:hypothetical protein [Actinomycetota bacterium]